MKAEGRSPSDPDFVFIGLRDVFAGRITPPINDNESGLIEDYKEWLHKLVDVNKDYKHNLTGEDNAYAHLMRTIMGREVVVAITNGKL
ncbi:YjbQ family protein, partial [Candidatus Kaiserbacteria bacterium]|nr:YjbQ family protein [Candidatus Kaiserbacteria bacterium]